MIRTTTLIIFLVFIFLNKSGAQDPRFSQFYASPVQLNPAMTGVFEGQMRVVLNYRDQWASILGSVPFRTMSASVDMRKHIAGGDYAAFGISLMRDQAGISRFTQTKGHFGMTYLKQLAGSAYGSKNQYLIAGAQLGAGQHSLDWSNLWFSRQFDPFGQQVDYNAPSGETENATGSLYLDLNAGLMWYAIMDDNKSIYLGGAVHHLNRPGISFLDNSEEVLYMRWIGHAGGEIPINRQLSFLPAVAVIGQGPSMEIDMGGNFRYSNNDWREVAIRAGLWNRIANKLESSMDLDAIIVTAVLEMENWNLGISYDINTSSLANATNSRGAFEVSVIYTSPEKTRLRVKCPNF